MIRKRAEERARQSEMESYGQPVEPEPPKEDPYRPRSGQSSKKNSREKYSNEPHKKHSMPTEM